MAATRTWTGAASDGNFSNTANWSAAVVPVTGDSVIVSATATYGMTTNLNRSADGAGAGLNIVSFEIEKGFGYDIGSSSNPLRLTADTFTDHGNGALYLATDTGTANLDTDRVIIDKGDISKTVYLSGSFSGGSDSTFTLVEVTQGANVTIIDYGGGSGFDAAVGTLWMAPRYYSTDVAVTTSGANISLTSIFLVGGKLKLDSGSGSLATIYLDNAELDFRQGTITTLHQSSGLLLHNCPVASGQITTHNAFGGSLDSTRTAGTKNIGTMNRVPSYEFSYQPKLVVTTTNYIGG